MEILVTNDDGVDAPGLEALAKALAKVGEVTVSAPVREMSAVSHALTISKPVDYERRQMNVFAVDGTPADCVSLAVKQFLPVRPDIVVSGINRGANLAGDIAYSGTVAGAREAAMLGIPALAVSLASKESSDYSRAAKFAAKLASQIGVKGMGNLRILNVNVPTGDIRGVRITRQGRLSDFAAPQIRRSGKGSRLSSFFGRSSNGDPYDDNELLTDIGAIREHFVSITPLQLDATHYNAIDELTGWGIEP